MSIGKVSVALAIVGLTTKVCHAQFANTVSVPPNTILQSDTIPQGRQVNILPGGVIPNNVNLGVFDQTNSLVEVNVLGGAVGSWFNVNPGSRLNLYSGSIGGFLDVYGGGELNVAGIGVGSFVNAHAGSQLNFYGTEFSVSSMEVPSSSEGERITIDERGVYQLRGTLVDGKKFDMDLSGSGFDTVSPESIIKVTYVSGLEGDYNSNGVVDQSDLDQVLLNWGKELLNPIGAGWINDYPNGIVDQRELNKVLLNWGWTKEDFEVGAIPEPSTALLSVLMVITAVAIKWRGGASS